MANEFTSKIFELETLKDRRQLLRQIQLSKQRLLYENPQAIAPFIRAKISQTLYDRHSSPSPEVSRRSTPARPSNEHLYRQSTSEYLEIMREQRSLIERQLQQVRAEEQRSRRDLERRIKGHIRSRDDKAAKNLDHIRTTLITMTNLQSQLPVNRTHKENRSTYSDLLHDLRNMRGQYLMDGGKDIRLVQEIDDLIKLADLRLGLRHSAPASHPQIPEIRNNDRANELRNMERQILEMEKELELRNVRASSVPADPVSTYLPERQKNPNSFLVEDLHHQLYDLQKEVENLKAGQDPRFVQSKLSASPSLTIDNLPMSEEMKVVVILDYITGIGRHVREAVISMYPRLGSQLLLEEGPLVTQPIKIRPPRDQDISVSFVANLRLVIMKCPVQRDVFVIMELKTKSDFATEYQLEAWTKIYLFPDGRELKQGKWRQPLFKPPIQQDIDNSDMHTLSQYHRAIVHYRVGTSTDNMDENPEEPSLIITETDPTHNYQFMSKNKFVVRNFKEIPDYNDDDAASDVTADLDEKPEFGLQVIRVKHLVLHGGSGLLVRVRLSAYHTGVGPSVTNGRRGRLLMAEEGPVTCATSAVRADFKTGCFQFGRQMGRYTGASADLAGDVIVIARLCVQPDNSTDDTAAGIDVAVENEEVIAWTAVPLVLHRSVAKKNPNFVTDNLRLLRINRGVHDLDLYEPPVVPPSMIFFDRQKGVVGQTSLGRSKLKLRIFHTKPSYDSATSSEEGSFHESDEEDDSLNKALWVPIDRQEPVLLPHHHDDGVDLYVDCARLLPDGATAVKLEGRIVDRVMREHGPGFGAITAANSDIFNPEFREKIEIREPGLPPSSTLLIKILTFDRETKDMVVMGYSALNLFTETGTLNQPEFDNLGVLVSLNEGGHQLRIYQSGPEERERSSGSFPFGIGWFQRKRIQFLPAASLLVRLYKPPKNTDGRTLNSGDVPREHRARIGVQIDPPPYEAGYYYSMSCQPVSRGEWRIMRSHSRRAPLPLSRLAASHWALHWHRQTASPYQQQQLYRLFLAAPSSGDGAPGQFDINHIVHYCPSDGFKISVDGAVNVPWSGITLAHICLYPPGALYMVKPYMAYDRPYFVTNVDLNSTVSAPIWKEGWKTYRRRKFNPNMVAIVHIHELNITTYKDDFQFTLENEAWAPLPIFDGPYCVTKSVQMPLIYGSPRFSDFEQLKEKSVRDFLQDNRANKKIDVLPQTSIIVRQCDSRRDNEVSISAENELLVLDQSHLPIVGRENYTRIYRSAKDVPVMSQVPAGFTYDAFQDLVRVKFRSLVYKLYDQDGFKQL